MWKKRNVNKKNEKPSKINFHFGMTTLAMTLAFQFDLRELSLTDCKPTTSTLDMSFCQSRYWSPGNEKFLRKMRCSSRRFHHIYTLDWTRRQDDGIYQLFDNQAPSLLSK